MYRIEVHVSTFLNQYKTKYNDDLLSKYRQ